MTKSKRIYKFDKLPYEADLSKYAPPYTPEDFTPEEKLYLKPFFSNVDKPIFVIKNLPEEVAGALSSRYSRATHSLRRMFLSEYINPIIHPDKQKTWPELSAQDRTHALQTKKNFKKIITFLNKSGGVEYVVNIQRARKFFDVWLAQYGDDSIAEMGNVHVCLEGLSMIAGEEIVNKRVGISPLVKSTRYVSFANRRPDGGYQYITPGELKGTKLETDYLKTMDLLFESYVSLSEPYNDYIKQLYPQGDDETDASFKNSRSAKRFDDLRDLLPFSTQTSFALSGNGRAFEDLINRLLMNPLGELRWWGQALCDELETVVPSFVRRPKTPRGAEIQTYRHNLHTLKNEMITELLSTPPKNPYQNGHWVNLVSYSPDPELEILATYLFSGNHQLSLSQIRTQIKKLPKKQLKNQFTKLLEERRLGKDDQRREELRFRKVPRAFENAHYLYEIWGRGGDYRDLHRHRQNTEEHKKFTTQWGYDLEKEVLASPFSDQIKKVLASTEILFQKLHKISPDLAQYAIPFAYVQHWYMNLTAREIYWITELRTGPQGRPHYRTICQQIASLAKAAHPNIFQAVMIDMNDYGLARRESEKKIDRKLTQLGIINRP